MSLQTTRTDREETAADGPILRLEGVGRTFRMGEVEVEVLRDVDLEIGPGELVVMVGPSGSGKTTLLNLVGGLDQPTAGRVWFRDRELSACSKRALGEFRREAVGFVFQFFNLVPTLTARENVQVAAEIVDEPLDVDECLRLVGLAPRADHFPAQLSGGEQQRVAIARALAKNPELLLCDEPTGALDFETGKAVLAMLWDVNKRMNKTVIIITHNQAIARMADRLIRIRSGRIADDVRQDHPVPPGEISW
ncbi:ABC transporter ATP-binding protein [Tautonia sociabilis]|uniref:ABC transporter ATP-binding protein n=1 Tax=Tautonia sociabilis TaxID=2080755 RepID=A0A432MGA8_9BACT|nr:ABC transporter ATP-binding protein [Tautonia sociabilis]RUL85543.1 ABC transporter ATP-binding protein [Tautonia sociabilis]